MNRKTLLICLLLIVLTIVLVSCMPNEMSTDTKGSKAGFFMGIWHGWIAPISIIAGIFKPGIRVYETYNIGWWYDLGFYIAVISGFGGISLFRRKRCRKENRDSK